LDLVENEQTPSELLGRSFPNVEGHNGTERANAETGYTTTWRTINLGSRPAVPWRSLTDGELSDAEGRGLDDDTDGEDGRPEDD
jgi:hypothetical protein